MLSITKLAWVIAVCLVGFWLGLVVIPKLVDLIKKVVAQYPLLAKLLSFIAHSVVYLFSLGGFYCLYIGHPIYGILFVPAAVHLIFIPLAKEPFFLTLIPNNKARFLMITSLGMLSIYSYSKGSMDAYEIKTGSKFQSASTEICAERYLGLAGKYMFFYDPSTKAVNYKPAEKVDTLKLFSLKNIDCDETGESGSSNITPAR